jgi:hypothetical protein
MPKSKENIAIKSLVIMSMLTTNTWNVIRHVTYERPELFLLGLPLLGVGLEQVPRPDSLHLLHLNLLTRNSVVRFLYLT